MKHQQHSYFLPVQQYQLHIRRLLPLHQPHGVVLMLHGAIENSRIFYSASGKGLGCYLADQGFAVFCADFAGRGRSLPHSSSGFDHSQQQLICQDIPALIRHLQRTHQQKIHLIAHSWGGVLAAASLCRHPELLPLVSSKVCFGSKRRIRVQSLEKRFKVDLIWNRLGPWLAAKHGYFPAKRLRLGADDEPRQFLQDCIAWIEQDGFVDCSDGFDYAAAAKQIEWPHLWHFVAEKDRVLGHPQDVQAFIAEACQQQAKYTHLGKASGALTDYDHISMLTHPLAVQDHFPQLANWLRSLTVG